jgi:hypothetical protein
MGNRPVPNLEEVNIEEKHKHHYDDVFHREIDYPWERPNIGDVPTGWDNPWPDLPNPDSPLHDIDTSKILLSVEKPRCRGGYLGYYLPWHIIAISYRNERGGGPPPTERELREYNNQLPIGNRFGIHICCNELTSYIERFRTDNIDPNLRNDYLNYCKYLTLVWVVAHEWGHYRAEVLGFQLTNILSAITGVDNSIYHPSFISYWRNKKRYPQENFEEVFAEWCSLKMGIFNYHMPDISLTSILAGQDKAKTVLREQLAIAMVSPNRPFPYRQIGNWVNMSRLTNDAHLSRVVTKAKSMNRSVNDNTRINDLPAFKNVRMVDLLMHNQIQFSAGIPSFEIIRSQDSRLTRQRLAGFYRHIGDDECMFSKGVNSLSKNFLEINLSNNSNGFCCQDSLEPFLIDAERGNFPIPTFPDILEIDPVYFHC